MPSIKDESTVEAIARAFTSNGRKQEQAMIEVGYTKAYARSYCGQLWANPRLKAAIARIDAESAEIGQRTVAGIDKMYQDGFNVAQTQKNPAAMATNTTGLARLYGMDKDNQVSTDKPTVLTADEMDELRFDAKRLTALRLRTG